MKYPIEFIAKVKGEYPDWTELHERLDMGDCFAGRLLNDASFDIAISAEEILEKTHEGLKEKARQIIYRQELYAEWYKLAFLKS